MSEILHGVLNMPPELWCNDEVSILQRHSCYLEASRFIKELEQRLAEAESQLPKWHSASTPPAHSYWLYVVYVFDGCVHKGVGRYVNAAEPYWISASRDVIKVVQWMDYPLEVTGGVYG